MNVVYLRLLVILVSMQTGETETGLFATSFRIFEILLGLPTLVLAVALPLLAVAGAEDRPRLRYALQRMTETAVVASLLLVLVTVVLAEPAIVLLGGEEYRDAAPILRVQAFALLGVFLGQVWTLGLVSLRRQRDVAVANGIALAGVLVLGLVLVHAYEGTGGAAAAVATEALLAAAPARLPGARGRRRRAPAAASCRGRSSPAPPRRSSRCCRSRRGSSRRSPRRSSSSSRFAAGACRPRSCPRCAEEAE